MHAIFYTNNKALCLYVISLAFVAQSTLYAQSNSIEAAGDVILFALPASALALTIILEDKQGTWQFTKGLLLTELVTFGLKFSITKMRPDLSNENSFPSGHTATVFHSAGFIHKRYGLETSLPAYALAGFTAFSRINADKHDLWDIVGGTIIGIGNALLFTTPYQKEHFQLSFSSSNNNYLLGFTFKF